MNLALIVDYGKNFGAGHISRCRGLIEEIIELGSINITCFIPNYDNRLPWLRDLRERGLLNVVSETFPQDGYFPVLICDSYQDDVWNKFVGSYAKEKIAVIDKNARQSRNNITVKKIILESFEDLQERAEKLTVLGALDKRRESDQLRGSIIWDSRLEKIANLRKTTKIPKSKILLSLGGSNLPKKETIVLAETLARLQRAGYFEKLVIFTHKDIKSELQKKLQETPHINSLEFGEVFDREVATCSLIICGSGTTSVEAFHLGIPAVVVSIFSNASRNFEDLQKIYRNAIFIKKEKLSEQIYLSSIIVKALTQLESRLPSKEGAILKGDLGNFMKSIYESSNYNNNP